ncbi:MAG: HI0074 family nucleotidyltransferase substrate-binding subunit [Bacteroidota bacterium]
MDLLESKRADAVRALNSMKDIQLSGFSEITRDAAIQRFEYTVEALWKYLQLYLREEEGIDSYSPKSCFREAKNAGLVDEDESVQALEMVDDRNLTSHTYHEDVAQKIYEKLPMYVALMEKLLKRMS